MKAAHQFAVAALALASPALVAAPVAAVELSGAWATDAALCDKVFTRKGSRLVFAELSDLCGSGFIIENARIRGKAARCTISSRKEDGPSLLLKASCATGSCIPTWSSASRSSMTTALGAPSPTYPAWK
jgi:hypothetical protein